MSKEVLHMCGGNHDHHHPQVIKVFKPEQDGECCCEVKAEEVEIKESNCGCNCTCGKK